MIGQGIAVSLTGLSSFALYFCTAVVLMVAFTLIYTRITPYREFRLINDGNTAASLSYGGTLLGFAIPLASAISHSTGIIDMVVWGIVALTVQLLTFVCVRVLFPSIASDIPAGQVSKGLFLGVVSTAAGIINAACMVY